jgi:metal-responsive CopG/Arc/MetJ family transcriptional regulator
MPTILINVRLDSKVVETLKAIASGKGEKYLSNIIREAITEYISTYTGEPTLKGLERRVKDLDARLKRVENGLVEISRYSLEATRS